MKQQWSLWILPVLLALLMGCQQQPTAPLFDSNTIPAGTTSITEETSPQTRLADAANLTITEVDQTIFVSKQELVPYSSVISVQATPEGAWDFGTTEQTDEAHRLYSHASMDLTGKAIASSTTLQPDEKVVCAYCADGQKIYLLVDTPEGQVLLLPQAQRISLTDAWDKGVEAQWLVGSDDGLLALSPDGHVAAFDLSGKLLWLDHYAGTIRGAMTTAGGEIRLLTQWETLTMLQLVDLANGRLMPVGVVPEAVCAHRLFPGDRWGYDLLALDGEALYGWHAGNDMLYCLWTPADLGLEASRIAGLACLREDTLVLLYEAESAAMARMFLWITPSESDATDEITIRSLREAASYEKSTAMDKEEAELGLTMEVPAEYTRDLMCNTSSHTLFSFFDVQTQETSAIDGWCWSILAYSLEDYEARYGQDFDTWVANSLNPTDRQLGRDDSYMYIFQSPTDVRYDLESPASAESYYQHWLHGYAMLTDFMVRNDITPSPDWDAYYRKELQGMSIYTGDYDAVEFGCGNTEGAEPALSELAARLPNLSDYDGDPALTWMDALTYRLNHAYLSGSTGHSEVETSLVMRLARPISESSIYDREEGSHEAAALSALFDFSTRLQDEPALAEACQSEAWFLYAAGDVWYLSWPGGVLETNPSEVYAAILERFDS